MEDVDSVMVDEDDFGDSEVLVSGLDGKMMKPKEAMDTETVMVGDTPATEATVIEADRGMSTDSIPPPKAPIGSPPKMYEFCVSFYDVVILAHCLVLENCNVI